MGTSTHDMFSESTESQAAAPGSYGVAPAGHRLPAATRLGAVRLQVSNLERSLGYYEQVLGFRPVLRDGARAVLAAQGSDRPIVELNERGDAQAHPARGRLGLYHFAILLPDRPSLGRFVSHLSDIGARAGASDHLVSEALYLQDPDGLGIEVYADRPRDTWRRTGRELMMATDPADLRGLVEAAGKEPWSGAPAGTVMGHVHLHVGDLERASAFYSDALGFDRITWLYPGALFLSAGGYHHHLGTNVWAGAGATSSGDDEAKLLEWTIELPDESSLEATAQSLTNAGYTAAREGEGARDVVTRDPWGTQIRLRVATP